MKKIYTILIFFFLGACMPSPTQTPEVSAETAISTFTPTIEPTIPPPPFSKEVLDSLGEIYYYQEGLGLVYKNVDGTERLVMKLNDARTAWVDDESYTEFSLDAYKPIFVNGVEPDGRPVKIIHTRVVGEGAEKHTEIYLPKTGGWRSTVGYEPGLASEKDVMKYKPVTMEDIESGFLRELKLAQQYKWPSNTTTPDYYLAFVGGSRTGALELTIFGIDHYLAGEYADRLAAGTGTTPILPPDMYRIQSPNDPNKWFPLGLSLQQGPNGEDLVFAGAYGSEYIAPGEGGNTSLGFVGPGLRTTYLLGMDGNTCEGASFRGNNPYQAKLVSDACAAFMPPDDEKWGRVSWDTILDGAEFGTTWKSKPLDIGLLSQYQDDVLVGYNW